MKLTSRVVALTFVGGAIGTLLRYSLSEIHDFAFTNFWVANLAGVIAIAIFNNLRWFDKDERKAFFTVGLTGGFTTMSGLSALMLYAWSQVLIQAGVGVVLYLVIGWLVRRLTSD